MKQEPYKPSDGTHYAFPDQIVAEQRQHPLLKPLFVSRAGYFPRFAGHETSRFKGIADSHLLIYCTAGKGWFESEGQRWTITPGKLIFALANVPHAYGADEVEPWTIHWVHFAGVETAVYLDLLQINRQTPVLTIGHHIKLVQQFQQIYANCQLGVGHVFLLSNATHLRQIFSNIALLQTFAAPDPDSSIEQTLNLMRQQLHNTLTVEQMAKQARLSSSHFSRLFHKKTGYAPIDYFIRLKMQRAAELLVGTTLLVKEIGWQLGYEDAYYFSRSFKKVMGLSPKQYRQRREVGI